MQSEERGGIGSLLHGETVDRLHGNIVANRRIRRVNRDQRIRRRYLDDFLVRANRKSCILRADIADGQVDILDDECRETFGGEGRFDNRPLEEDSQSGKSP